MSSLFALPDPPNPADPRFSNLADYNKALYQWANTLKSQLQTQGRIYDRPAAQSFVLGTYTPANTLSGTDTTTNVAQVLCTLIQTLISKNIIKQNTINQ